MAKFAELTDRRERRILVNPEHVMAFGYGNDAKTWTSLEMPGETTLTVTESPDEVLARLCAPVMPEGLEEPAQPRATAAEIIHEIDRFRRWSEEHDAAKTIDTPAGSTDELGQAWELLDDIADRLKALL